jgi:hypothetical protein
VPLNFLVARFLHTGEVVGSILTAPTIKKPMKYELFSSSKKIILGSKKTERDANKRKGLVRNP